MSAATDSDVFADREATEHDKLTVLKFLAGGRDIAFAAEAAQLTEHQVAHIASAHGYPDRDKLQWGADIVQQGIDEERSRNMPAARTTRLAAAAATPPTRPPAAKAAAPSQRQAAPSVGAKTSAPDQNPEPATQSPAWTDDITDLIRQGMRSDKARVRAAAQKVIDQAQDLQARLKAEATLQARAQREQAKREEVLAEVRALEAQLAAAKEKLRPPKKKKP